MRILHTSDLHLDVEKDYTLAALDKLLTKARDKKVDLLTIGGDLFEGPEDADQLRPELRNKFEGNDFGILTIPGNHDQEVYGKNLEFGSDIDFLVDRPFDRVGFSGVNIVGLPYCETLDTEIFSKLCSEIEENTVNILLLHCTLNIGYSKRAMGPSEQDKYFPVNQATLSELGFDYYLAGHFHSNSYRTTLNNGSVFLYPGSSVSLSRKETGQRHAFLLDTDNREIQSVPLDTRYLDTKKVMVHPGQEESKLEEIRNWIGERREDNCKLRVEVDGHIQMSEKDFDRKLKGLLSKGELVNRTKDVSEVLEHDLYKRFKKKVTNQGIADSGALAQEVMAVLSELLSSREVSR